VYIELHTHSNFSLLDGASHSEDLVARAAELGMPALALTDHDALYDAPCAGRKRSSIRSGICVILPI